jgi:hypothetical protein
MSNPSLTLPASALQNNRRRTFQAVCLTTISADDDIHVSGPWPRSKLLLALDYATRLTDIKNKTPGNVAGRF